MRLCAKMHNGMHNPLQKCTPPQLQAEQTATTRRVQLFQVIARTCVCVCKNKTGTAFSCENKAGTPKKSVAIMQQK